MLCFTVTGNMLQYWVQSCWHLRSQLDLDSVHTLPILTHYPTLVNNFPNISL